LHWGRLGTLQRELHSGLLGTFLNCEERERERERERESNCQCFCEARMYSLTVHQVQLPCARSDSLIDHKSSISSSSTATWRGGSSIRRSLELRVCVHPQFHCTHQQLLKYTALLPRAHGIETEAALIDHGNCKLSCFIPLYVCLLPSSHSSSHSTCGCFICRKILP
jgi:hypothetical protein